MFQLHSGRLVIQSHPCSSGDYDLFSARTSTVESRWKAVLNCEVLRNRDPGTYAHSVSRDNWLSGLVYSLVVSPQRPRLRRCIILPLAFSIAVGKSASDQNPHNATPSRRLTSIFFPSLCSCMLLMSFSTRFLISQYISPALLLNVQCPTALLDLCPCNSIAPSSSHPGFPFRSINVQKKGPHTSPSQ